MSGLPGHMNANASASAQELAGNGIAPAPLFPAAAASRRKRYASPPPSPSPYRLPSRISGAVDPGVAPATASSPRAGRGCRRAAVREGERVVRKPGVAPAKDRSEGHAETSRLETRAAREAAAREGRALWIFEGIERARVRAGASV
ncbi:hypothetical protein DL765_003613 [Monosporascus sp. GIB2]|nr:hypothetical protein DL765_003613 [Monosporascus sp. GIB2]